MLWRYLLNIIPVCTTVAVHSFSRLLTLCVLQLWLMHSLQLRYFRSVQMKYVVVSCWGKGFGKDLTLVILSSSLVCDGR